ncbi:MAG: class I SAM-dependent methyltransferase [Phycisphaerales bacterium]|nr:class I SAM-dependent methyltransferase [Phycisphaerales bacterium]
MNQQETQGRLKSLFKLLAARAIRPGVLPLMDRLDEVERVLEIEKEDRFKYTSELAYWRYLVKEGGSQRDFGNPFEVVFGTWQRNRLKKLADFLGVPHEGAGGIDEWCESRSVIELGAGPYPAIGAARRGWKRAIAVDPISRGYIEEGLVPECCARIVFVEAKGEQVPLPSAYADLVVIENCLDHVTDPLEVIREMNRLLKPGGLVWFFVDLSNHIDQMHPHAMNEGKVRKLLVELGGFKMLREEISSHKAHPQAYGGFRALLQRGAPSPIRDHAAPEVGPEVHVRGWPNGKGQRHHGNGTVELAATQAPDQAKTAPTGGAAAP